MSSFTDTIFVEIKFFYKYLDSLNQKIDKRIKSIYKLNIFSSFYIDKNF
jgi:hypothetical protein